jgi:hypothetical protein
MSRTRSALLALTAVLALANCAQTPSQAGRSASPGITVGFGDPSLPENRDRPTIEVVAVTRLPIWRADLIMPDGNAVPGAVVEVERLDWPSAGYGGSAGVGVGVGTWGGSSSGVGGAGVSLGFPVFGGYSPPPQPLTRSRARITPTDMEAYRRDWTNAKLRLVLGGGPDAESVEIPAPTPAGR